MPRAAPHSQQGLNPEGSHPKPARAIAFYLPQYHRIPENDAWWGENFTEWTNVRRAAPLFEGHHQPRVPADLGYYDLTEAAVMERQAELARRHGIEGFCLYYYHFEESKKLLDMPLRRMLASGQPDFPFCLCWANETWSRLWDGDDHHILVEQKYRSQDLDAFARGVIPAFSDPRYIRVEGKPLLLIYRARSIPDTKAVVERWRHLWREEAGLEVHLCAALTRGEDRPGELGFDSAVEFPPYGCRGAIGKEQFPTHGVPNNFPGALTDYRLNVLLQLQQPSTADVPLYPTVTLEWDNTARRKVGMHVFLHFHLTSYYQWLSGAVTRSREQNGPDQSFVFINAWNEWAEGAYLEPDEKWGSSLLEMTSAALDGRSLEELWPTTILSESTKARLQREWLQDADAKTIPPLWPAFSDLQQAYAALQKEYGLAMGEIAKHQTLLAQKKAELQEVKDLKKQSDSAHKALQRQMATIKPPWPVRLWRRCRRPTPPASLPHD